MHMVLSPQGGQSLGQVVGCSQAGTRMLMAETGWHGQQRWGQGPWYSGTAAGRYPVVNRFFLSFLFFFLRLEFCSSLGVQALGTEDLNCGNTFVVLGRHKHVSSPKLM